MRASRQVLAAVATLLLFAVPLPSAASYGAVRCDPACNVRATTTQGPANEVALAADPANPLRVIAAAKDYSKGTTNPCSVYNVWAGIYRSSDGGRTWTDQLLPSTGLPSGTRCISDPVLAYGPGGVAYYFGLALGPPNGAVLFVERSLDGGATWQYRAEIARSSDKQWAAVDPSSGRIWVTWVDTGLLQIWVASSGDGGATWSKRAVGSFSVNPLTTGQGPEIAVGPPNAVGIVPVYIAWRELASGTIMVASSLDGGATWAPRPAFWSASAGDFLRDGRGYRYWGLPSIGVDVGGGPRRGTVYIAYTDLSQSRGEVRVARSLDGGISWVTTPVEVPSANGVTSDEFMPALAVSPSGDVHVFSYSTRDANPAIGGRLLDVHYSHSADGLLWDAPVRVTTVSSDPTYGYHQNGFRFIGDYIGAAASGDVVYGAWADFRNLRSDVYVAAVPR